MGESKKRDILQERVNQAKCKNKYTIAELHEKYGLPENAVFCGYVIHLPESDEFLAELIINSSFTQRLFSKTPEMAKVFQTYKKAEKAGKHCKQRCNVGLLFDIGDQYYVLGSD